MISFKNFIKATNEYNTFEKNVSAPYIRKSFTSDEKVNAKLIIAACGFYEIYINGKKHTKGFLAPYISNTDHYIYYDEYTVPIDKGENVIGVILGNGFQNNPGGYIWDFDKANFRSAPMVALTLSYTNSKGDKIVIESDGTFKTFPSAILSDDYRFGIFYDANCEVEGWNQKGFDDSLWKNVIVTKPPSGEIKLCQAAPIVVEEELKPVSIKKLGEKYIYDFGVSNSGVCRLNINGNKGQKIELQHSDSIMCDGSINLDNVWITNPDLWERDKEIVHKDTYICSGKNIETFIPQFTYHGFRYVEVSGISDKQANPELLTFLVFHSRLETRGGFSCSNDVANKLQEMTRRSVVSNFHYFPTDCPQREKNGWTADAALSCEHTLINFNPEVSYREWLRNICKAQNEAGAIPGIVPTAGWGYEWGNGPAWDCVLTYLPYYTYVYRGQTDMIRESAEYLLKYLKYISTRMDDNNLLHFGLGDWCQVGMDVHGSKAPLKVTDSIIAMDISNKCAFMFDVIEDYKSSKYAKQMAQTLRCAIRKNLIDDKSKTVFGNCQTCQAMALFYGVFEDDEKDDAYKNLLDFVHRSDDHIDLGVLGGRVIFHVLSEFGDSDLAFKMITRPDYPSYGNWVERGATTLWEDFLPDKVYSMNHHFWGDISSWFIKCIAGIHYNPEGKDITQLKIKPSFVKALDNAEAYHISPFGKIVSSWKRNGENITLSLRIPDGIKASIDLENDFCFSDGTKRKEAHSGNYFITVKL